MLDSTWLSLPMSERIAFETPHEERWQAAWQMLGVDSCGKLRRRPCLRRPPGQSRLRFRTRHRAASGESLTGRQRRCAVRNAAPDWTAIDQIAAQTRPARGGQPL
jgi:hypothetical protein